MVLELSSASFTTTTQIDLVRLEAVLAQSIFHLARSCCSEEAENIFLENPSL